MTPPPDLSRLTEAEKDTLILALWAQVQALTARVAELEARLNEPTRTPGNSSLPPSRGHKANRPGSERRAGPRRGSLGRAGGGRPLAEEPDQFVIAKAAACAHCRAALDDAAQVRHARYDKVELPPVRPVVTRVERYLGRCPCCGGATLAPVPEGMDEGSPFGVSILALALYLRFTHAISYRRLTRLFSHLLALQISEGALDALFRRAKPRFDDEAATILAPRLKALLLRAVVLARRRHALKASTRREYRLRLERELDRVLALQPSHRCGLRLRKRYLAVRDSLFTFLEHPDAPPDNNGSERDLRPMVVYRKVTGGFRSAWGPDLCAAVASVVGTAARRGIDAYHAIHAVLSGRTVLAPG